MAQPGASAGAHEHGPVDPQTGDSVGARGNSVVGRAHMLEREREGDSVRCGSVGAKREPAAGGFDDGSSPVARFPRIREVCKHG